jgi:hypothetical protein
MGDRPLIVFWTNALIKAALFSYSVGSVGFFVLARLIAKSNSFEL